MGVTTTAAVILAAGKGTRMNSALPKVLHPLAEVPLLVRVVRLAQARSYSPIVVVIDADGDAIRMTLEAAFPGHKLTFAVQHEQRGTGDAMRVGLEAMPNRTRRVITLYGDVPLLRPATLERLEKIAEQHSLALLATELDQPAGYGRLIREDGRVLRVVEERDATPSERAIREVNVGVYHGDFGLFAEALDGIVADNDQNELYLTDVVALAAKQGSTCAVNVLDIEEVRGINTRSDLAQAEAVLRRRWVAEHQSRGVTFRDPESILIGEDVAIGRDSVIGAGVQLFGRVEIATDCRIEGPSVLRDVVVDSGTVVEAFSHLEGARLRKNVHVGPYARIRPGSDLGDRARVGNFVELKNTTLGAASKANHLSYLGDAHIDTGCNIGAGTITCNYDGVNKHTTAIESDVFVGSNTTLIAPLTLSSGSYVGAGSVVTQDVPSDALAIGRARQQNRLGYASQLRARSKKKDS